MARGALLLLGVVAVAGVAGWARATPAVDDRAPDAALERSLAAAQGELGLAQIQLQRANTIIDYATRYGIPADVAASIHDIALAEGVDPRLAFHLVSVESGFTQQATSPAGAIGYTQTLLSTARLYEPGLTVAQLYDRETNLRIGFRYLRDLLERYATNGDAGLGLALLAYNRGPARLQELLDAGRDPHHGYATAVMTGYRP
jgi:soluble lytic murein transglycosylase-like protein